MWHKAKSAIFMICLFNFSGCGDANDSARKDLTSVEGVEREVVIAGQVFVSQSASAYTINSAVARQVRTAFGPLRIAKISVDDREFRSNVDPQTFEKTLVTVVRDQGGTPVVVKDVYRVDYTYRARGLVNKAHANKASIPIALLMGNYQTFVSDIIHDCVEDYEHDSEFSSSFWYVFAPNEYACQQRIEQEVNAINAARQGLEPSMIPEQEYNRRFLPLSAKLLPTSAAPDTYPEYHRFYGVGDPSKIKIAVHAIFGLASHDDDPESKRFENDMGFSEFFKAIKVLTSSYDKLRVAEHSPLDPMTFTFKGKSYTANDFDELEKWVISGYGLPSDIDYSDKKAFRRAIYDHLYRGWIRVEVPLDVTYQGTTHQGTKEMVLEVNLLFGTESDWSSRNFFRHAFSHGDVVIYDGHSYIGSGPLDPTNYSPSDFRDGYQVMLFNSCVSFNYYNVDYFDHKANGSNDLDLVTNGIESYIYDGGKSMGQFIVALFDGKQNSWRQVLTKTRVPWWGGYHDPNRAVDGELDNAYDPASTPITVVEGDWNGGGGGGGDPLFVDDMEGTTNWTATGMWHLSTSGNCASPAYASPESAFYFGQDSSCTFSDSSRTQGTLTSVAITGLTANSKLTFKYYRDVEKSTNGSYDHTKVQVTDAGSDSYETVWSRDSKDASEQSWLTSSPIDLSAYAGRSIKVRFLFDSVDNYANNFTGWLIDDVKITQ